MRSFQVKKHCDLCHKGLKRFDEKYEVVHHKFVAPKGLRKTIVNKLCPECYDKVFEVERR